MPLFKERNSLHQ